MAINKFQMSYWKQLIDLRAKEPRMGLVTIRCENSPYVSYSGNLKSCYMISGSEFDEDCYYGFWLYDSKDCVSCDYCRKCELCYECVDCIGCYNTNYSLDSVNCTDCEYLYDCASSNHLFGCVGQRRAKNMIFNKPVENYDEEVKRIKSEMSREEIEAKVNQLKLESPRMYVHQLHNENCTGDYMYNSKNSFECFDVNNLEDCMYCNNSEQLKDCLDMSNSYYKSELCYEVMSEMELYNCDFCVTCFYSHDLSYCENVHNSKFCFGCFSMNHAEYCIFNKKYSKEEFLEKKDEIIKQMKKDGKFGQHLPSTYKYEDSNAAMHWAEN